MKSVLLTFLIFFIIFTLLKMNILDVISSGIFHFISYACILTVIGCGIFFIGLPSRSNSSQQLSEKNKDIEEKEQNNEKN